MKYEHVVFEIKSGQTDIHKYRQTDTLIVILCIHTDDKVNIYQETITHFQYWHQTADVMCKRSNVSVTMDTARGESQESQSTDIF